MKATLTKIGNSKGIIIPMHLLKQCGFEDEISMEIKEDSLILSKIRKLRKLRNGWKEQFIQAGPVHKAPAPPIRNLSFLGYPATEKNISRSCYVFFLLLRQSFR